MGTRAAARRSSKEGSSLRSFDSAQTRMNKMIRNPLPPEFVAALPRLQRALSIALSE